MKRAISALPIATVWYRNGVFNHVAFEIQEGHSPQPDRPQWHGAKWTKEFALVDSGYWTHIIQPVHRGNAIHFYDTDGKIIAMRWLPDNNCKNRN